MTIIGTTLLQAVAIFSVGLLAGFGLGYGIASRVFTHLSLFATKSALSKNSNVKKLRKRV